MTVLARGEVAAKALSWRVLVASDVFSFLVFAIGGRMMHSFGGTRRLVGKHAPYHHPIPGWMDCRGRSSSVRTLGRAVSGCVDLP